MPPAPACRRLSAAALPFAGKRKRPVPDISRPLPRPRPVPGCWNAVAKVLEDSRCRTQEAALRLETARTAWTGGLHSLGLPEDLTPGTVHAALDGMGELFAPRRRAATGRFAPATSARRNRSPAGTAGRPAGRDGTPRTAAGCRLAPASGNAGRGGGGRPPPCRRAGPPAPAAG